MSRRSVLLLLFATLFGSLSAAAGEAPLRVLVVDNAPPMSYRDASGVLTGFSVEVARALCTEMRTVCAFVPTTFAELPDELASGRADVAAAGMLDTPARRAAMLYSEVVFRSVTLLLTRQGLHAGQPGMRIAVVAGSAQEAFVRGKGWDAVAVRTNGDLAAPVLAGRAQAVVAPMVNVLELQKNPAFRKLAMMPTVLRDPMLGGDAYFGISPLRPELKERLDAALGRIKRNGAYDRINTRFLPFRMI